MPERTPRSQRAEATRATPAGDGGGRGDVLQHQARALGDPTRHAIFRVVCEAGPDAAVGVAELTERFGLNHNAIRQHLAKLCEAGLVVESLAPSTGPGRRRLQYRVHPSAAGSWRGPNPYEELAGLLLEALQRDEEPRTVGFDAGRRAARDGRAGRAGAGSRRTATPGEALDRFEALVANRGFEPTRVEEPDGDVTLVLNRCPFASAAAANASIVCSLHLGLAEGMADACGGEFEVTRLVVKKPDRAGCRIELHVPHPPR